MLTGSYYTFAVLFGINRIRKSRKDCKYGQTGFSDRFETTMESVQMDVACYCDDCIVAGSGFSGDVCLGGKPSDAFPSRLPQGGLGQYAFSEGQ